MNKLLGILKITFINKFELNAILDKNLSVKDKKKIMRSFIMIAIMAITILILVCLYANLIAMGLEQMDMLYILPLAAALGTSLVVFMTSIYKSSGILFSSRDYDFLMSLPISNKTILTSKIIELMSFSYGISALIMIPSTIVYFIRSEASVICFLYMIIGIILLPLLPIVVSAILGSLISLVSSKFRFSKLITLIGTLLVVCGILIGSLKAEVIMEYVMKNANSIVNVFERVYPPSAWFADALINNNILSMAKFLLISFVPFTVFIYLFSSNFKKIVSKLGESYQKSNYKLTTLNTSSVFNALLKNEFKKLSSSPSYLMNTVLIPIMLIIFSAVSMFSSGNEAILGIIPPEMKSIMIVGIPAVFCCLLGTGSTTLSTISFEGKNLWILKTMPVKIKDIFLAKALVNIILCIPAIVISGILLMIGVKLSFIEALTIIIVSSLFTIFISYAGIYINLKFPKLEWTQELQAVKNTMSVTVGLILSFMLVALSAGIYFLVMPKNPVFFLWIIAVVIVILIILIVRILNYKGEEIFKKL